MNLPPLLLEDFATLFAIGICLIASAIFSSSETAITSLGVLKTKHLLDSSNRGHKALTLWLNHPSRVLTTILVWNNTVNILTAALVTDLSMRYFGSSAIGIATGITTFLVLVFGEIIPKSFAKAHADVLAIPCLQLVIFIYRLSYPVVKLLSDGANFFLLKMAKRAPIRKPITEEEIEYLISVGKSEGIIGDVKNDMISGVFEFDETKAREVMTPRTDIIAIERSTPLADAIKLLTDSGHSRVPVYEKRIDRIIGILLLKDLLKAIGHVDCPADAKAADFMRPPIFYPETKPLIDLFKDLKRTKNHLAIVIDEYGGTAGIITMEDIIEEIVGEIQDEYDVEEAKVKEIQPDTYDVVGSMHIAEFFEFFHLENESETLEDSAHDVDTVAGWMTQQLGAMPKTGQKLTFGPLKLEVTDVGRHRIQRLRVVRTRPKTDPNMQPLNEQAVT